MIQSDHETPHAAAKTDLASPMFYRMRDVLRMTALSRSSVSAP